MSTRTSKRKANWLWLALVALPVTGSAQVPVDESGNPVAQAQVEPVASAGTQDTAPLDQSELQQLVGRIALYPDDLLAIVLPASTYPLQIVEAARFLDALKNDPSLKPDDDWDDSVVALTNYPEVVRMMNEDLDWTWKLGEAVVAQQTDVIKAIESFRDQAYAAGNLKSDDFQKVTEGGGGTIQITPTQDDVIYVPYYEPERVVVYQPRPVYYYYPRPYPVYYYPYPVDYVFPCDYFWGVTTAFTIGWYAHDLNVFHYSYYGHPYYGHPYYNHWWYRRPDIRVYNNYYVNNHNGYPRDGYDRSHYGDHWGPHGDTRLRPSDQRITRTRYYPSPNSVGNGGAFTVARSTHSDAATRTTNSGFRNPARASSGSTSAPPIHFRPRTGTASPANVRAGVRTARPATQVREPATTRRSPPAATPIYGGSRQPQQIRQSFAPSSNSRSTIAPQTHTQSSFAPSTSSRSPARATVSRQPQVRQAPRQSEAGLNSHRQSAPAPARSTSSRSDGNRSGAHFARSHSSDRRQ
jgi:Protein of unknown function (DUF3300)